jgi:hypothetical protein
VAETVGSLADKLSIVELKIYHMQEQADRADADPGFRERCLDRAAGSGAKGSDRVTSGE